MSKATQTMTARYAGTCLKCGQRHIEPGDSISFVEEYKGWIATSCLDDKLVSEEDELDITPEVTPEVQLVEESTKRSVLLSPVIDLKYTYLYSTEQIKEAVDEIRQAIYFHLNIISTPRTWKEDLNTAVSYGIMTSEDAEKAKLLFPF